MLDAPRGRPPVFPLLLLFCLLCGTAAGIGTAWYGRTHAGTWTGVLTNDPKDAFLPKTQLNVLVMGLDENWTNKDMAYTKGARTDTLFVAHLDLVNKKVSLLSIPRDTRVPIAGTSRSGKINSAYASGGAERACATVSDFLGVPIDYHIVLKLDSTKKIVDSVGGVDLDVEKDMNYDDNWGHLHIHLQKGLQHLDGEQAVGYIRFRHDVEGDFGRMRRQQQLIHAIVQRLKSPLMVGNVFNLAQHFPEYAATDLSEQQIASLALLYKNVGPGQMTTASLPATEQRIHGIWFLIPDEVKKQHLVDWLLRDKADAVVPLVKVEVVNGSGDLDATRNIRNLLKDAGFEVTMVRDADRADYATTQVIDYDRIRGAGDLVISHLGLKQKPVLLPNPHAVPCVEVIVGRDAATSAVATRATQG